MDSASTIVRTAWFEYNLLSTLPYSIRSMFPHGLRSFAKSRTAGWTAKELLRSVTNSTGLP